MDVFNAIAICLAIIEASFICIEFFGFYNIAKDDLAALPAPKIIQSKKGILGLICNLFIGVINSLSILSYMVRVLWAAILAVKKSPGILLDIGATLFFTWIFGGAFSALTMTMGLAANVVFSVVIMIIGIMSKGKADDREDIRLSRIAA